MKFHEQLNAYIEQIDCMAKEVSEQSGVSAATLSRYRTVEAPRYGSDAFENLLLCDRRAGTAEAAWRYNRGISA